VQEIVRHQVVDIIGFLNLGGDFVFYFCGRLSLHNSKRSIIFDS